MKSMNGMNSVLSICFKISNGNRYHQCTSLNRISRARYLTSKYIALEFQNTKKSTFKSIRLQIKFGSKSRSITSYRIPSISLLGLSPAR